MRVALVNDSPAVSRLVTLSLNKMGYEYVESQDFEGLQGGFDMLVLDSDIDISGVNLRDFAERILFLASKNSTPLNEADKILQKPFLPTEFISIMEILANTTPKATDDAVSQDSDTDEFHSFIDEPVSEEISIDLAQDSGIFDEIKIDELEEVKIDDFNADSEENSCQIFAPLNDTIDEISGLMNEIDEMPVQDEQIDDEISISNFDENIEELDIKTTQTSDDIADIDELLKEIDQTPESIDEQEFEIADVQVQNPDESLDEISFDENLEIKDETDDLLDEQSIDEFAGELNEDEKNLDENIDELADLNEAVDEKLADELDENPEISDDLSQNLDESADKTSEISDIDDLSERELRLALDESVDDMTDDLTQQEDDSEFDVAASDVSSLKADLANKISEQISAALSESELKSVLKDLNIKINISFEDK